jgi:hypothetical protein
LSGVAELAVAVRVIEKKRTADSFYTEFTEVSYT